MGGKGDARTTGFRKGGGVETMGNANVWGGQTQERGGGSESIRVMTNY